MQTVNKFESQETPKLGQNLKQYILSNNSKNNQVTKNVKKTEG